MKRAYIDLDDASWKRFDLYSIHVKNLSVHATVNVVDSAVWGRLALSRPGPMLSNLTYVYCLDSHSDCTFFDRRMFLISSHLKKVYLDVLGGKFSKLLPYLSFVQQEACLDRLVIVHHRGDNSGFDPLPIVAQFKDLRSLRLVFSDSEITSLDFGCLCQLQKLIDLELFIDGNIAVRTLGDGVPKAENLACLEVYLQSPDILPVVLRMYEASPVENLLVTFVEFHDAELFQTTLDIIPLKWLQTLTVLEISYQDGMGPIQMVNLPPVSLSSLIGSLYDARGLEELTLSGLSKDVVYVADSDIFNICNAWPNLTRLIIDIDVQTQIRISGVDQLPTVSSFYALSAHCPALKTVQIPFYPGDIPPIDNDKSRALASSPGPPHRLRYLFLYVPEADFGDCNLTADGSSLVAYHLNLAFPLLNTVEVKNFDMGDIWSPTRIRWDAVNTVIGICHDVRRRYA